MLFDFFYISLLKHALIIYKLYKNTLIEDVIYSWSSNNLSNNVTMTVTYNLNLIEIEKYFKITINYYLFYNIIRCMNIGYNTLIVLQWLD